MIKGNELRLGNWVNLEFVGPFKWEYTHFEDYLKDKAHGYDVEEDIISDKIEPIPLTPGILDKAGFASICHKLLFRKYLTNGDEMLWSDDSLAINHPGYNFQFTVKCQYLHQLQNIVFALTAEELEVNL